ncbi:hypothetical protein [Streptococcus moroccensis]|uniref:Uncharacterized protein n=1 Tax=Streptococcus moroccensis TaxID=1451356 RepID=A0ABT9YUJ1_9STRE|nr:hypothetical protein [Streptococcus moroccensis]MDQ0223664.1 hypothetical protein [Streptococcus moroccensis]
MRQSSPFLLGFSEVTGSATDSFFSLSFFDVIPKSSRLFYDGERVTDCYYLSKEKKDFL